MVRCLPLVAAALIVLGVISISSRPSHCRAAEPKKTATSHHSTPPWPREWKFDQGRTFTLRGRIDTDAIGSSQDAANEAAFGELEDTVGLRRARIGGEGKCGEDSRYVVEIDLASSRVVPRDVYYAFGDRQQARETQIGHFREPFSFEGGTSARYFAFMERSPVNMFDPARNWGLGWFCESFDSSSSLAAGVFHTGVDTSDFQGGEGSTVDLTGRWTTALWNEGKGEELLHFGVAISERIPENGDIILNQKPNNPLLELEDSSSSPFVPEIRIPAEFQQLVNFQFAAVDGPLWTQAEWYGSFVDPTAADCVFFHGCHFDCGWFITGEHRAYDSSSGTLGAVRVNRPFLVGPANCRRQRGWGAWELTGRFAWLDTIDSDTPAAPNGQPVGIELPQWTAGVNWYLCDRVRMLFNYSHVRPDDVVSGSSSANILGTRLAIFW